MANNGAKKYKYPFEELIKELRRAEPTSANTQPSLLFVSRMQWERDVRAITRAISHSSITNFDPERFCHSLGIPFNPRAEHVRK